MFSGKFARFGVRLSSGYLPVSIVGMEEMVSCALVVLFLNQVALSASAEKFGNLTESISYCSLIRIEVGNLSNTTRNTGCLALLNVAWMGVSGLTRSGVMFGLTKKRAGKAMAPIDNQLNHSRVS